MDKIATINYAEGYEDDGSSVRGLLVSIDGEEAYFCLSDDLKSTMERFVKLQSRGYELKFSEKRSRVNPNDFVQVKKEYRD